MFRRRIIVLSCLFGFAGLVLLGRLAQIQLDWSNELSLQDFSRSRGHSLLETARGSIYTADGVPLARDKVVYDLSVHYPRLKKKGWRRKLSRLADVPVSRLAQRAQRIRTRVQGILQWVRDRSDTTIEKVAEQTRYHPVLKDVKLDVAAYVRTHPGELPGVKVTHRAVRRYPNGSLVPHVVGHMSRLGPREWDRLQKKGRTWEPSMPERKIGSRYLQNDKKGATGVEQAFEPLLRGQRGYVEKHLIFRTLEVESRTSTHCPKPGADVYLTLRSGLQKAANQTLAWAAGREKLQFQRGSLVVLDVQNGAVLAAATYPSFDLSRFRENFAQLAGQQHSPLLYRPTQAAIPPGSVFKLVTATAGLQSGEITTGTAYNCDGYRVYRGRRFNCVSQWGHGQVSLVEAIRDSCNVYFYEVGRRVGGERLAEWGKKFGLARRSGIRLPNRRTGRLPEPASLYGTLNLAIGQGDVLVTPLQVARMAAGLASGGRLPEVHFFRQARGANGQVVARHTGDASMVQVSDGVLQAVKRGMRQVVSNGTAEDSGLNRFRAAGKTGTASVTSNENHAWFAGYAPYGEPRVAFAVVNERTPGHGGSHAAPIAAHFLEKTWDVLKGGKDGKTPQRQRTSRSRSTPSSRRTSSMSSRNR